MNMLAKKMLLGGSVTALIAAAAMTAQAQPGNEVIETVEVSSSRLNLSGFQSPTPVTVIGIESIERNAHINIGDEIRDLPQVRGTGTQSANTANIAQANAGIDTLNIRNLGAQRNLVLFDGQRSAISGIQDGTVDLSTIPSSMIQRIDVVTGGASAAWGSDAVTGVINIVINKNFTGVKANVEYSDNLRVAVPRYHFDGAWGTDFMGGKGHFQVGATWTISNTATFNGQDQNQRGRTNVYNPAYCAAGAVSYTGNATTNGVCTSPTGARALQYVYNAGPSNYTQGGLVNGNSAGATGSGLAATSTNTVNPNAGLQGLQGLMFTGPAAQPTQFNYGTVYGTNCYNGCTNNQYTSGNNAFGLSNIPYHGSTIFTYTSYQLMPDLKLGIQLGQGKYSTRVKGTTYNNTAQTIYADNAYLDPAIARRFVCTGTASPTCVNTLSNGYNPLTGTGGNATVPTQRLVMGIDFTNNRRQPAQATGAVGPAQAGQSADPDIWTMANVCSAVGEACGYYNRVYNRGSLQLDGVLSSDWTWSAYVAWSGLRQQETAPNDPFRTRMNNALDAVRITSTNQGTSNLPIGSIQCRGLLTPANLTAAFAQDDLLGCQPVNVFGSGNVSQAAYQFISPGVDPSSTYLDKVSVRTGQTAAGGELTGVLPWALPAGEVSIATGFEYRLEQAGQYDVPAFSSRNILVAGNWVNYSGAYNVKEGFLETNIPIVKDFIVDTFDLNLVGRYTSYSTSGDVQTWKIGFNSQINDDFRVRGFYSSDIRAPTVYDLYNPGAANQQQCANWVLQQPTNPCSALPGGNPNLKPEQANTVVLSAVFTPTFIEGLTASLDWYDLRMHGAITTVGYDTAIARAKQGEQLYCDAIITSDGSNICNYSQTPGTTGVPLITGVRTGAVNAARLTTAGFDANIDYRFDLFSGQMSVGVNANYMYDWSRTLNGIYYQGAGASGGYYSGGAAFRSTINLTYEEGAWTFGANIHVTGDAERDPGSRGTAGITQASVTYARINGVDYGTLTSGQTGEGFLPTNYQTASADIGGRVQYRLSDSISLYAAMDRIFPGNKSYRAGMRFRF